MDSVTFLTEASTKQLLLSGGVETPGTFGTAESLLSYTLSVISMGASQTIVLRMFLKLVQRSTYKRDGTTDKKIFK